MCLLCGCVFGRALIEGEDTRLSTMVQGMSLGGGRVGVAISASSTSASVSAASVSGYGAGLGRAPGNGYGGTKEAPGGAVISPESQTESFEEQSVEMTERKTLLIR